MFERRSCPLPKRRVAVAKIQGKHSVSHLGFPLALFHISYNAAKSWIKVEKLMDPIGPDCVRPRHTLVSLLQLSPAHPEVHATLEEDGTVTFQGDSDALISKGSSLSSSPVAPEWPNRPSTNAIGCKVWWRCWCCV